MISCKEYVFDRKNKLKQEVNEFQNKPKLVVVQVGDDYASSTYINGKRKDCKELGILFHHIHFKDYKKFSDDEIKNIISNLNSDESVNGIIIQLPIPDRFKIEELQTLISPEKDVDGFLRNSLFYPCTPKGIIDWLKFNGFIFKGKKAVVIGRSKIVGKPLTNMLIDEGCTVTCCNRSTTGITRYITNANLVVSAIGKPKYFDASQFCDNQIIIDVGINRDGNGKLCGDINPENFDWLYENTYLTPVPGGVGLLTRIALMENTILAYKIQKGMV